MEAPVAYHQYVDVPGVTGLPEAKKITWKWAEIETPEVFRIDDLLNFSNEEIAGPVGEDQGLQPSDLSAVSSVTFAAEQVSDSSTCDKTRVAKPTILEEEDLCVPCDDIAQLEWLSTFVEDSFSTDECIKLAITSSLLSSNAHSLTELSSSNSKEHTSPHSSGLEGSVTSGGGLETAVPGRARSKRSRAGVRVWSSRLLSSNTCTSRDAISTCSMPVPSFFALDCPAMCAETEFLTPEEWEDDLLPTPKKPTKIPRRKTGQDASQSRRCTHCLTQRTPQWRAGPMGPKTLCNACGVRFKSGRLLPEYRPAGSPTFVSDQHSNSHRKVLEMRKQKIADTEMPQVHAHTQASTEVKIEACLSDREQKTCDKSSEEPTVL